MLLAELEATFRRWLHLPDAGSLHASLAAVAANRAEGDPVWLLLVGPPGGGKSEIINALAGLEDVHPAATLTEAALLSGTPSRERDKSAKGGLLRVIGDRGIITAKDFGSVLSMNRDARGLLLAALREVYDGSWTRHVGTDGGRSLHWEGRVGFIGGVTPTIDRHHAVMGAMGERFVLYRLPPVDPDTQAGQALAHAGHERAMRSELATAVRDFLHGLKYDEVFISSDDRTRLISLATLVVRARSAVERDSYSREIELIPEPEAPTRLPIALSRFLQGLDLIGLERDQSWQIITKLALDSIPRLRVDCLWHLYQHGPDQTPQIAEALEYPTQTVRRALEDLAGHSLVLRTVRGEGQRADTWTLSEFARNRLAVCVPVMSLSIRRGEDIEALKRTNGAVPFIYADTPGTQTEGSERAADTSGTQNGPPEAPTEEPQETFGGYDDIPF